MTTDRRLVIDTNLWISRLLVPDGVAAQAVDHGLAWGMPLMSQATLAELAEVLSRPRFDRWVTRAERQQFLRRLGGVVAWWLSRNQQGQVNGQLTAAPGGATRRLNECAAAGRAAAEVGARALPDAPPSRVDCGT